MADTNSPPAASPLTEPPEGSRELALQERQAAQGAPDAVAAPAPVAVGRSYAMDFALRRLSADGGPPAPIYGVAARRQRVEKCVRTFRGSAAVTGDDYGVDPDAEPIDGGPADPGLLAEWEDAVRDALLAEDWVLEVSDFDIDHEPGDDAVFVSFAVLGDAEEGRLFFDRLPVNYTTA